MESLTQFRQAKDEYFKKDRHSPLTRQQRAAFNGLDYFPENPALRLELILNASLNPEQVDMQTSTGDVQAYYRVGQVEFAVNERQAILQVYQAVEGGEYFIPFVDATAPEETYGAGRYLEPLDLGDGRLLVDFNLAYNPYCAYNDLWSCPLPPQQNRLAVRIEAGEKKFDH